MAAKSIPGVRTILAVSSGKGGVGKSTVSVNLACALAQAGHRVGLMDADIYGPNIPTMLGVTNLPEAQKDSDGGEWFLPAQAHGIQVMSMGFLASPEQPMIWRGPMLHNILTQFCHRVKWGELDVLVIDMPPGTGDIQLSLAQLVPVTATIMVTTPQEISLQDVRRAFQMWHKVRVPVMGIVENMSFFLDDSGKRVEIFGSGGGRRLSEAYGAPLLLQVPLLTAVRAGGDEGHPLVLGQPNHEISQAFGSLGRYVMDALNQMKTDKVQPEDIVQIGSFQ